MLDKPRNAVQLAPYTIEKRGRYFYYWRSPFFSEPVVKGPYISLRSATMMIARDLYNEAPSAFKRESNHA
jgi:hypothetical protein